MLDNFFFFFSKNRAVYGIWSDIYLQQLSSLPVAVVGKRVHK